MLVNVMCNLGYVTVVPGGSLEGLGVPIFVMAKNSAIDTFTDGKSGLSKVVKHFGSTTNTT